MGEKERFMEATRGARIRRRGQELGMTQLDLAERTELSEATVRSYELGTSNPQDAHHEAIAEAMGVSADYLREYDGYRESEIVHFLMEMEDAGFLRPVLIDGTAYVIPVQANLEDGIQEWTEKERDWRFEEIGEEEYLRWKASYDPAGAQRRIASGVPTAISIGTRRRWVPNGWKMSWRSCRARATEKRFEQHLRIASVQRRNNRRNHLLEMEGG